jgi:hypothetical protein
MNEQWLMAPDDGGLHVAPAAWHLQSVSATHQPAGAAPPSAGVAGTQVMSGQRQTCPPQVEPGQSVSFAHEHEACARAETVHDSEAEAVTATIAASTHHFIGISSRRPGVDGDDERLARGSTDASEPRCSSLHRRFRLTELLGYVPAVPPEGERAMHEKDQEQKATRLSPPPA